MRVTGKMIRDKILSNTNRAMENLQFAQTQLATGKRILKPSDDPLGLSKAMKARAVLADDEQYVRNIEDALSWLENTEPAVDDMVTVLTELKEIAVEGANDTKSAEERLVLAAQVEDLIERLMGLGNTEFAGKYVFAGTYTTTPPYSSSSTITDEAVGFPDLEFVELEHAGMVEGSVQITGPIGETYTEGVDYEVDYATGAIRRLGGGTMGATDTYFVSYETEGITSVNLAVPDTDGDLVREIAPGLHEKINTGGEEIFASRLDIFGLLIEVKNHLLRDDGTGVNGKLDEIDAGVDHLASVLSDHGMTQNTFQLAQARLESEMVNMEALISHHEDADMAEVMVRFETEQMAYESALAAAAEIMNTTLINFIT
jgi:flagellar hook-associated protein 3 FlgL